MGDRAPHPTLSSSTAWPGKLCGHVTPAIYGHDHVEGSRLEGCWPVASSWCILLCMKRWFVAFVLLIWSLVTASAAETFAERLAAMQSRLESDPTNTTILFQLGDICHEEGGKPDEKAVILAEG